MNVNHDHNNVFIVISGTNAVVEALYASYATVGYTLAPPVQVNGATYVATLQNMRLSGNSLTVI